jgi:hypothetical protein
MNTATSSNLTAEEIAHKYDKDGFFVLEGAIPDELLDAYSDLYDREHGDSNKGWGRSDQYAIYDEIRNILCHESIEMSFESIEMAAALHVEMSMQESTECKWHKDSLLQDLNAASTYIGVLVCLEDIDPRSGPFELIPGSHKWTHLIPLLQRSAENATPEGEQYQEDILLAEKDKQGAETFTFLGKKGDVLVWHSQLAHRGTKKTGIERRPTLIGHYCGNYSHTLHEGPLPPYEKRVAEMEWMKERYDRHGENGVMYFTKDFQESDEAAPRL